MKKSEFLIIIAIAALMVAPSNTPTHAEEWLIANPTNGLTMNDESAVNTWGSGPIGQEGWVEIVGPNGTRGAYVYPNFFYFWGATISPPSGGWGTGGGYPNGTIKIWTCHTTPRSILCEGITVHFQ